MILKQYCLGHLVHASYLQQCLADTERFGLQIRRVLLSHFHADFVAGHLGRLADRGRGALRYFLEGDARYMIGACKSFPFGDHHELTY